MNDRTTDTTPADDQQLSAIVAATLAAQERRERTLLVLAEVATERERQYAKHRDQAHLPDGTGPDIMWSIPTGPTAYVAAVAKANTDRLAAAGHVAFSDILFEEVAEAFAEKGGRLRAELVQVAAVAVQWIEAIDRRAAE